MEIQTHTEWNALQNFSTAWLQFFFLFHKISNVHCIGVYDFFLLASAKKFTFRIHSLVDKVENLCFQLMLMQLLLLFFHFILKTVFLFHFTSLCVFGYHFSPILSKCEPKHIEIFLVTMIFHSRWWFIPLRVRIDETHFNLILFSLRHGKVNHIIIATVNWMKKWKFVLKLFFNKICHYKFKYTQAVKDEAHKLRGETMQWIVMCTSDELFGVWWYERKKQQRAITWTTRSKKKKKENPHGRHFSSKMVRQQRYAYNQFMQIFSPWNFFPRATLFS